MSKWTFREIQEALHNVQGVTYLNIQDGHNLYGLSDFIIDSRAVKLCDIFCAFEGLHVDGHDYIESAAQNGAKLFLISHETKIVKKKKYPAILVENMIDALCAIARFRRSQISGKVIMITGSVGKTTTTQSLAAVLGGFAEIGKTIKNYNNKLGLSLSLLNTYKTVSYAVYEGGMDKAGEMEFLSKLLRPNLVIILNIFLVHAGSFMDIKGIADAKCEIMAGLEDEGIVILNKNNDLFSYIYQKSIENFGLSEDRILTFGSDTDQVDVELLQCDLVMESSKNRGVNFISSVSCLLDNEEIINFKTGLIGKELVTNLLPIFLLHKIYGFDVKSLIKSLALLKPLEGRGEAHYLDDDILLLDESYNASYDSIRLAMDKACEMKKMFQNQGQVKRLIFFVGSMLGLGDISDEMHKKVASYVQGTEVDLVVTIGDHAWTIFNHLDQKQKYYKHFSSVESLRKDIKYIIKKGDLIVVKASNLVGSAILVEDIIKDKENIKV